MSAAQQKSQEPKSLPLEVQGKIAAAGILRKAMSDAESEFASSAERFGDMDPSKNWPSYSLHSGYTTLRGFYTQVVRELAEYQAAMGGSRIGNTDYIMQDLANNAVDRHALRSFLLGDRSPSSMA